MKKPSMLTIIGSSGRGSVLMILFQLYGTKAGHFKVICSGGGGVSITPPHILHIGRRANPILIYNSLAIYLKKCKSKNC